MNNIGDVSIWGSVALLLALIGRFLDYLFKTEYLRKERRSIQLFFIKIFDSIDRADFTKLQLLVVKYFIDFFKTLFKGRYFSFRFIVTTLLISQYLTISSFVICYLVTGEKANAPLYNIFYLIPFGPYTGISQIGVFFSSHAFSREFIIQLIGIFWNNYLFDHLTILTTFVLLRFVYDKKKHFILIATSDIILSYLYAFLCLFTYIVFPPHSHLPDFSIFNFISYLGGGQQADKYFLAYSLTTFVPVTLYLSILLFFSITKLLKKILAPIASDFAHDNEKTVFLKLGVGLGGTILVIRALIEIVKSILK